MKKMKKYIQITLVALLPAMLLDSCVRFEEENIFDESAALRLEHSGTDLQDILTSQPNGWVMQYYCGTGVAQFEGFNLFAKFDANGKVLMASNHRMLRDGRKNQYTEHASLYELISEDGLVLAFNTWNNILTPFVDPVAFYNAPDALVKDGEGMEGDHNFVVTSYTKDEVVLRGERHGAEVRLVACDRDWQQYIADADAMKNKITNTLISSYYVANATDTLYITGLRNGRMRYCERVYDPLHIDSLACVFTPKGFSLEHEQTLGTDEATQTKFRELVLSDDNTCLVSTDGQTKVIPCWDNYLIERTSIWTLDEAKFSAEQKSIFEDMNAQIQSFNAALSLDSLGLGTSTGGTRGLILFYHGVSKGKTNNYNAGLGMDMNKAGYGKIAIECPADSKIDKNMTNFSKTTLEAETRRFASTLTGTFEMTPNNYFKPTGATYKPVSSTGTEFKLN